MVLQWQFMYLGMQILYIIVHIVGDVWEKLVHLFEGTCATLVRFGRAKGIQQC